MQFLKNIGKVLPCITCRINYNDNMRKYPVDNRVVRSRYDLINWLLSIHNEIRISQGKSIASYESIIEKYTTKNEYCFSINCSMKMLLTIFVIVLLIILLILLKVRNM